MDAQQDVGTGVWHARGEAAIRASGITFTFVQPTGFMVNALLGGVDQGGPGRAFCHRRRQDSFHPYRRHRGCRDRSFDVAEV